MRIFNESVIFPSNDLSVGQISEGIYLGHIVDYAIQIFFTGSPLGNFKLQVSNDLGQINSQSRVVQDSTVVNWSDVADSAFTVSAAGDVFWDVQNAGHRWVRVVWTATGGSGTITSAKVNGKGV